MRGFFFSVVVSFLFSNFVFASVESRIEETLKEMTLDEKVSLIGGAEMETRSIPRLNIPALKMTDGPLGVRFEKATAFPSGVALASSWDPVLMKEVSRAVALETLAKGKNVLLGPCINIHRTPQGGRNFESFGEDPYLTAELTKAYVEGIQSENVLASAKHFALNNQEVGRLTVDVRAKDQAIREIYLPGFLAAVKAGVWSVMAAYNKVNGQYASENEVLLNKILKQEWGFKGFVLSDWGATHSAVAAANNGLDLEMPWPLYFNPLVIKSEMSFGLIAEKTIDDKVRRLLRAIYSLNLDKPQKSIAVDLDTHHLLSTEAAAQGAVLLKNDGFLPLNSEKLKRVLLIGPYASVNATGGGSSIVDPLKPISASQAFRERLNSQTQIDIVTGSQPEDLTLIETLAAQSDAIVAFMGWSVDSEGEGKDRKDLRLQAAQVASLESALKKNRNVVVVLSSGGAVLMQPWLSDVRAVFQAWYLGQGSGEAIAQLILGEREPSGRLPVTLPQAWEDAPAFGNYPGVDTVTYSEGIFVGYRHFDRAQINPEFEFGFGLSYTDFKISGIEVSGVVKTSNPQIQVTVEVANTGKRVGSEVVQLYVANKNPSTIRPPKELKAFQKIALNPGESQNVTLNLDSSSFSYYDESASSWKVQPGEYDILVGSSSRKISERATIYLQ